MTGPGNFATLNAGDGDSKNWFEQAAGRGSSWAAAGQDLADASSPPEWGVAMASARAEQLQTVMSPFQSLVDNGLGFVVSIVTAPLVELLELVVGDPEQMRSTGEGWEKVASWLDEVSQQEAQRAAGTQQSWTGKDGDAFRKQMTEFSEGTKALAQEVRGMKETLDMTADIFDLVVEFLVQTLTELVLGLIVQWLAALAASWVTAGASVAAAGVGTTAEVAVTGGRIATRVAKLQGELFKVFQNLERILQRVRETGRLRWAIEKTNKLREGGQFKQMMARRIDRNTAAKFLTKADDTDLSTKAGKFAKKEEDLQAQDWFKDAERSLDDRIAHANANRDNAGAEALQQQRDRLATDVKGVQGLVHTTTGHVLSGVLGGQATVGRAATTTGMEMGTDAVVEEGAKSIYAEGRGTFQGDLSQEQSARAQERGFQ